MEEEKRKHYLILECTACNRYLLAASNNKTRACPYCGKRMAVGKARVVRRSQSAGEARLALQELKMRDQNKETSRNAPVR